jgi:hypothetical protein
VFRLEEPLREICFVGIKEQMINDSEMLVMKYDERKNKTEKTRKFFLLYCLYNIFIPTFNGNERVVQFLEIFSGYIRKYYQAHLLESEKYIIALDFSHIKQPEESILIDLAPLRY